MQTHNVCTANYRHWKKRITSSSCQILLHAGLTVFAKVQKQRATCCCAPSAMGTAGESHQLARRAPLAHPARQLPAGALAQGRAARLHPAPQPRTCIAAPRDAKHAPPDPLGNGRLSRTDSGSAAATSPLLHLEATEVHLNHLCTCLIRSASSLGSCCLISTRDKYPSQMGVFPFLSICRKEIISLMHQHFCVWLTQSNTALAVLQRELEILPFFRLFLQVFENLPV